MGKNILTQDMEHVQQVVWQSQSNGDTLSHSLIPFLSLKGKGEEDTPVPGELLRSN